MLIAMSRSMQHVQYVFLFSTGGKFRLVPNFTELHALTQAARSLVSTNEELHVHTS